MGKIKQKFHEYFDDFKNIAEEFFSGKWNICMNGPLEKHLDLVSDLDSVKVHNSKEQSHSEDSKKNFFNILSNKSNEEGSNELEKSEPQNKKDKPKKIMSDGYEENFNNNSKKVFEESKSRPIIKSICYNCSGTVDLIQLECEHSLCDPCLSNMVELQCSKDSVYILKCICSKVIKSKKFEGIVLEDTLFEYLDRLNSYKLKYFGYADCPVCGHNHTKEIKCSNFFKGTQNIQVCSCGQPAENFLVCDHYYCNQCLKELIIETWGEDANSYVECKHCSADKTRVPLFLLEKCFGGSKKYQKMKKELTECKICFKTKALTSLGCEHRFCNMCIKQYIEDKIVSMKGHEINCPDCNTEIDQKIIKDTIDDKLYEKYINMSLKRNKVQKDKKDDDKILWCGFCQNDYKASRESEYKCPQCNEKNNYRPSKVLEKVIHCPCCLGGIYKDNGCNFIECGWPLCNVYFCALCNKQLKIHQHYSHYKSSGPFSDTCNKLDKISKK